MKNRPLGWPLLAAATGTLLSLALSSKRAHIACGALWAGLSALHAWQYRQKLARDFPRRGGVFPAMDFPQSKLDLLIRGVEVAAYLPGRVRLYARPLAGNAALARQVEAELSAKAGVTGVRVNPTTGSLLIEYDPAALREDPALARAEDYFRTHAKRRV